MNSSADDGAMSAFADVPMSPHSKDPHAFTGGKAHNHSH